MMFEKETRLAPPESRPRMVKQQKSELKKLDKLIEAERQKQATAIDSAIEAGQEDLGAKQRKREDALSTGGTRTPLILYSLKSVAVPSASAKEM